MKILYFDIVGGIAGDMAVAALVELGVPLDYLREGLGKLELAGLTLATEKARRHQISGTRFLVSPPEENSGGGRLSNGPGHSHPPSHPHRSLHRHHPAHGRGQHQGPGAGTDSHRAYREVREMIAAAALPEGAKDMALRVFARLAEAEGEVHGMAPEEVIFHEVGAWDAIADVVCAALAVDRLAPDAIFCSPVPLGSGTTRGAHGVMPVPAPATLLLLRGFPVVQGGPAYERTTPTGAALLAALARPAPQPFDFIPHRVGVGIGTFDGPEVPNLLRAVIGESGAAAGSGAQGSRAQGSRAQGSRAQGSGAQGSGAQGSGAQGSRAQGSGGGGNKGAGSGTPDGKDGGAAGSGTPDGSGGARTETIECAEANLDDANPEWIGYLMERLLEAGALDVVLIPVHMKKNRPGTLVQVLYPPALRDSMAGLLFSEGTTLGVRFHSLERLALPRENRTVVTPWGEVAGKVARVAGEERFAPEFDSCRETARRAGVPLQEVYRAAQFAFMAKQGEEE